MSPFVIYGLPGSTYVQIVCLLLAHKDAPYEFRDIENEMNTVTQTHRARSPLGDNPSARCLVAPSPKNRNR